MAVSIHLANLPSPGVYARGMRKLKALPGDQLVRDPFAGCSVRADVLLAQFQRAVDNRINVRGGVSRVGWERSGDLAHDARIVNDAARRIRWSGRNLLNDARMARRFPAVHNPACDE